MGSPDGYDRLRGDAGRGHALEGVAEGLGGDLGEAARPGEEVPEALDGPPDVLGGGPPADELGLVLEDPGGGGGVGRGLRDREAGGLELEPADDLGGAGLGGMAVADAEGEAVALPGDGALPPPDLPRRWVPSGSFQVGWNSVTSPSFPPGVPAGGGGGGTTRRRSTSAPSPRRRSGRASGSFGPPR